MRLRSKPGKKPDGKSKSKPRLRDGRLSVSMRRVFTCCRWPYAPVGQTPVLRVKLTRDHLWAIGGITPEGRIFMQMQDHAYKGPDVVRFLQLLLRKIAGKILVIWDGAPIHRCQPIKDFLAKGGAKRIRLERLPGYAPELNPQEGVCNLLKRVQLHNLCCLDLQHLEQALLHAKERLRHRKATLSQCYAHAGYRL